MCAVQASQAKNKLFDTIDCEKSGIHSFQEVDFDLLHFPDVQETHRTTTFPHVDLVHITAGRSNKSRCLVSSLNTDFLILTTGSASLN